MINNLFYYATKELSQDAFICWLFSYALPDTNKEDHGLKACAMDMLIEFLGDIGNGHEIVLERIDKQIGNIDVLLSVKCDEKNVRIIIEDKVHASEHDDQLTRYYENVSKDKSVDKVVCIYFKTGFQSDYSAVKQAGYKVFGRRDLLRVLERHADLISNDIFCNYYEYWKNFEDITQGYRNIPCSKWDWRQIYGFFDEAQSVLHNDDLWCGYDYVANRSGGFYGLWFGIDDDHIEVGNLKVALYLQLECQYVQDTEQSGYEYRLCLKFANQSDNAAKDLIELLRSDIVNNLGNYNFSKPSRLGRGQHMTLGIYNHEFASSEELKDVLRAATKQYIKLIDNEKEFVKNIES
ncbi:endonuclease NucS domain-containing protein [Butyrivibrio sp. VCD2006]|uniref:endonuclease NucS domain-containing protein n=1 Tax=Butyrivibrio sp. VCD2006 TaxID=1280664 RepID=UPI0003FBA4C7|nr:endonuclease NucS domain-containing protein [Butyrivibrio sp. VCD2006]